MHRAYKPNPTRDAIVRQMHAFGRSTTEIGIRLGVSSRSVRWYLEQLGLIVPQRRVRHDPLLALYRRCMSGDPDWLDVEERSREELRRMTVEDLKREEALLKKRRQSTAKVRLALAMWERPDTIGPRSAEAQRGFGVDGRRPWRKAS